MRSNSFWIDDCEFNAIKINLINLMNWLKRIFYFHDWKDIEHLKVDVYGGDRPIYTKYVYNVGFAIKFANKQLSFYCYGNLCKNKRDIN